MCRVVTPLTSLSVPGPADVAAAAARISRYARRTPIMRAEIDGRDVVLKLEHLQRSGSFKLRGGLNALLCDESAGPIVAASGGNHGLGVSMAAALLGREAVVYVPTTAPESKVARIEAANAHVVRVGSTFAEAATAARQFSSRSGRRYVDAYDDPDVVAGQGTLGLEIAEDTPDVDAVVVAGGGGGLSAGLSLAIGDRQMVIVEPDGCCDIHRALAAGGPVDSPVDSIAASALGATRMGDIPYAVLTERPPVSVLVSDAQILAARDLLWEQFRLAVEPAAAAAVAALRAGLVPGALPCLVLCGANSAWAPQT
jgi:threonine dehydratase